MKEKGINLKGSKEGVYHLDAGTQALRKRHELDTLEYNIRHAEDHLQKAREACEKLDKASPGHPVPVSKELLDLFDYFEKEAMPDKQKKADQKLKKHIQENY